MISRRLRRHIRLHEQRQKLAPCRGLSWLVDESIDPQTASADHFCHDFDSLPRDDERDSIYFDVETTGLGATKRIFMAGFLFWEGEHMRLIQDIARDPAEEALLIARARERFLGAQRVVTYNGRSFDMPFVRRRLSYHSQDPLADIEVIDLLHMARRRYKGKLPDCRLATLEREVLRKERTSEDVPGQEAPLRFMDYVETGKRSYLEPVLYHNRIDLTSMVALLRLLETPVEDAQS